MKNNLLLLFFLLLGSWTSALAVPPLVNYAGRVAVKGQPFEGTGQLKFALVNASGKQTYWSNDGTSLNGSEPTAHVSVQVNGGLYSILLGNTAITGMSALDVSVFRTHSDVKLRVWFSDGKNGFQQLSPDRPFSSVPYALSAGIPDGSIELSMLSPALRASLGLGTGQTSGGGNQNSNSPTNSNPPPTSGLPAGGSFIAAIGNSFYFAHGKELWVTDGSPASSLKLKTFYAALGGASKGTVLGNLLFFTADDGTNGRELWKSDGTVNGTSLVKDIAPGAYSSSPDTLTADGNLLYFNASDGTQQRKFWKSDGTGPGTTVVFPERTGGVNNFVPHGNQIYFKSGALLYKTDGTAVGTVELAYQDGDILLVGDNVLLVEGGLIYYITRGIPGRADTTPLLRAPYLVRGNILYGNNTEGTYSTDGTPTGTSLFSIKPMLGDYTPGAGWNVYSQVLGESLYFPEKDGYDYKLMKSNSTTTSTVKNFGRDHALTNLSVYGNYLLFDHGAALWKSDGTEAGTVMIKSGASTSSIFHSTGNTVYLKTGSSIETINLAAQ